MLDIPKYFQSPARGVPVRVYWNLHKNCYSVLSRHGKGWHVDHHSSLIYMRNVSFVVSLKGRERCLRLNRKTVHAYLDGVIISGGEWLSAQPVLAESPVAVTYNPFRGSHFCTRATREYVKGSAFVRLSVGRFSQKPCSVLVASGIVMKEATVIDIQPTERGNVFHQ